MIRGCTFGRKIILFHIFLGLFAATGPLLPFFLYKYFYIDWENNLWVIHYYARYFRIHHEMPLVLNSANNHVGMTNPLYYGYLYYQILGLLDVIAGGARRALLIGLSVLLLLNYAVMVRVFSRAFHGFGERKAFIYSHILTIVALWSVYFVTKLYDDGARGENSGILLLYLILGSYFLALNTECYRERLAWWSLCALNVMLLAGTHPITAEIGGVLFAALVLLTLPKALKIHPVRTVFLTAAFCILILTAVSPWLYACVQNAGQTRIAATRLFTDDKAGTLGNVIVRLMPFPFDIESLYHGVDVPSPYLNLQINTQLMLIALVSLAVVLLDHGSEIKKSEKLKALGLAFTAAVFFCFTSLESLGFLTSRIFFSIQFVFRLITYVDLSLLACVLYNAHLIGRNSSKRTVKLLDVVMIAALTLTLHNQSIHFMQAYALHDMYTTDLSSNRVPSNYYWMDDYSDLSIPEVNPRASSVVDAVLPMDDQMESGAVTITLSEECIIRTNISASPWNRVVVNGTEAVENDQGQQTGAGLFRLEGEHTFAMRLPAGTYTISCRLSLPGVYIMLRRLSYVSAIVLFLLCAGTWINVLIRRKSIN